MVLTLRNACPMMSDRLKTAKKALVAETWHFVIWQHRNFSLPVASSDHQDGPGKIGVGYY